MLLVEATNSEHLHVSDKLVFLQDWGGGGIGLEQGWTRVYPVPPWHWIGLDSGAYSMKR